MNVTDSIKYIGVNDHEIDLFEGQYIVPNGMAYNSYVILDDKTAVIDTVDANFGEQWMENLKTALDGKKPDYLVVHHMEPDHSANIAFFMKEFPDTKIVASAMAFVMMKNYFGTDYSANAITASDGFKLSLGKHELSFVTAPNVHWPEVVMSYDSCDKLLFSADAFGKFGALDVEEDWACEARRYYAGIVGKFGVQVQALLKKVANLDIQKICPLHGPIITENIGYYVNLYNTWSSYGVEAEGVMIAYTSVYGNTKKAVEYLAQKLVDNGCPKVALSDLARGDMAEVVEDAFKYGKIVLATTTYNGGIFPFMKTYLETLVEHNVQNRKVAFIENGSWLPTATKHMRAILENSKNITYANTAVSIKGALTEANKAQLDALASELL